MTFRPWRFHALVTLSAIWGACVPAEEPEEPRPVIVIIEEDGAGEVTPAVPSNDVPPAMLEDDGCVDADGDGWSVDCVDFGGLQPDCNDGDPNNWLACATCIDADGDGRLGLCDAYDGLDGPDCDDDDPNNWESCARCVDADGDGFFSGCDDYVTLEHDCEDSAASVHAGADEVIGNGVDDDCDPQTPDECRYTPTPAVDPEPGYLAGVTRAHNRWRWRVGVAPLEWNAALAQTATAYAERCIWEHDPTRSPDAGFQYVGENLYATSAAVNGPNVLEGVQAWADERYDFDFGFTTGQTTGGQVGHYTQMVWHETTDVGCGWASCNSIRGLTFGGTMVVCRYGPGGNYTGQRPYDFQSGVCLDLDNDDVWQAIDPDDTDRTRR